MEGVMRSAIVLSLRGAWSESWPCSITGRVLLDESFSRCIDLVQLQAPCAPDKGSPRRRSSATAES